jgi:hypothetical protein
LTIQSATRANLANCQLDPMAPYLPPRNDHSYELLTHFRHAPMASALPITPAAEDQPDSHDASRNLRIYIVRWFVVVTLLASAAFVTMAPFIWL